MLPSLPDYNVIFYGVLAGLLSIFINYIIGKPGNEFSPYEIFSSYTVWLSKWKLKRLGLYETYEKEFGFESASKKHQLYSLKKDSMVIMYNAAEPFFTWERAVGMCSICTGFWISLFSGILYTFNFIEIIEIIIISHITIRLLNKLL